MTEVVGRIHLQSVETLSLRHMVRHSRPLRLGCLKMVILWDVSLDWHRHSMSVSRSIWVQSVVQKLAVLEDRIRVVSTMSPLRRRSGRSIAFNLFT